MPRAFLSCKLYLTKCCERNVMRYCRAYFLYVYTDIAWKYVVVSSAIFIIPLYKNFRYTTTYTFVLLQLAKGAEYENITPMEKSKILILECTVDVKRNRRRVAVDRGPDYSQTVTLYLEGTSCLRCTLQLDQCNSNHYVCTLFPKQPKCTGTQLNMDTKNFCQVLQELRW